MAVKDKDQQRYGMEENLLLKYGGADWLQLPYKDEPRAVLLYNTRNVNYGTTPAEELALAESDYNNRIAEEQTAWHRDTAIGPVVKPGINSLRGYKFMLRRHDGVNGIEFDQDKFGVFDGILVRKVGVDDSGRSRIAAFNPESPRYHDYAPLRRNIAILRNYLLCEMFPDGVVKPQEISEDGKEDLARLHAIQNMADHLGGALAAPSGYTPSLTERWGGTMKALLKGQELARPETSEFLEKANIPDKGIQVMYDYLFGLHNSHSFKDFYSKDTPAHWPMPKREDSPFSDENFAKYSRSSQMHGVVSAYETKVMGPLRSVDSLTAEDRSVSVEYAREILEKLKHLMASATDRETLSQYTDENLDKSRMMLQVALAFKEAMADLKGDAENPDLRSAPHLAKSFSIFDQATEAMEQISYRMKLDAHRMLVEEKEPVAAKNMERDIEATPPRYKTSVSSESLLETVGAGLKEMQQQKQIADRIAQRQAQRMARKMAQQQAVRQGQQNAASSMQQTYSKASVTRASAKGSKEVRKFLDEMQKAADANAPLLNPNDKNSHGR